MPQHNSAVRLTRTNKSVLTPLRAIPSRCAGQEVAIGFNRAGKDGWSAKVGCAVSCLPRLGLLQLGGPNSRAVQGQSAARLCHHSLQMVCEGTLVNLLIPSPTPCCSGRS